MPSLRPLKIATNLLPFLAALLLVTLGEAGCKAKGQDSAPTPVGAASSATTTTKPALPPEPPPPAADKAAEVPGLEAALAKDTAYQAVWNGPRSDLNAFLSYVSELVATSGANDALMKTMHTKKLHDAAIKLFMVFGRLGRFPNDFTKKLSTHLDATKAEPHGGTWSAFTKGGAMHDYSSLAAWSRGDDAALLREHIASKRSGAGPFGWEAWQGKGDAPRPWLVTEVDALDRLALVTELTSEEQARRESLRVAMKKEAAAKAEMDSAAPVTAATLWNAYQGNEVSADEAYKGKKLLVSGTVASIEKGPLGGIVVRLATPNEFIPVDASLEDSEKSKAGKLTKGDDIKLLCAGNGMVIGRPQLGDCTVR